MATFSKGAKVLVALDYGENAGDVLPGTFDKYGSKGYAYVDVPCPTADHYTHSRRVKVGNISAAEKVKPLRRYEDIFGKDG